MAQEDQSVGTAKYLSTSQMGKLMGEGLSQVPRAEPGTEPKQLILGTGKLPPAPTVPYSPPGDH